MAAPSGTEPPNRVSQSDVRAAFGTIPCDRLRLLIVDDQEMVRALLKRIVAQSMPYCRQDAAASGAEALKLFREAHHGVILLDIQMPEMNGEEVFRALEAHCRRMHWQMPSVLFLSGFAAPEAIDAIVTTGQGHGLLAKPVSHKALIEALRQRVAAE